MISFLKLHKIPLLLFLSCCAFYFSFAYNLERTDFLKLFSLYAGLFFLSWKFFKLEKYNFRFLVGATVVFRLIFLFSFPNLSQDFYRFIWDGKMFLEGVNPYIYTPQELISGGAEPFAGAGELVAGMGELSAGNPTNYPPLNQLIFALAALLGAKSILGAVTVMRLIIIAADLGILYFGKKLLKNLNLSENRIFWYLLNPLIIIELTGNLHFEGVMLFFFIAGIYLLHRQKWLGSAVLFACSVGIKLIPLMFLPLLFRKLGLRRALTYFAIVGLLTLISFLPFTSVQFVENYSASVGLWFQKFEFNASIWYLIRWIGYQVEGYNVLTYVGPFLGLAVFLAIILLSFLKQNITTKGLLLSMLFGISIYLFLATTVHPWYLATPLLLSVFTRYKFVLVWSFMVVLSYFAYSQNDYREILWLIGLEYIVVFGVVTWELLKRTVDGSSSVFGSDYLSR